MCVGAWSGTVIGAASRRSEGRLRERLEMKSHMDRRGTLFGPVRLLWPFGTASLHVSYLHSQRL